MESVVSRLSASYSTEQEERLPSLTLLLFSNNNRPSKVFGMLTHVGYYNTVFNHLPCIARPSGLKFLRRPSWKIPLGHQFLGARPETLTLICPSLLIFPALAGMLVTRGDCFVGNIFMLPQAFVSRNNGAIQCPTEDRLLLRYVQRRREEASTDLVALPSDTLTSQLNALQISRSLPSPFEGGIVIGYGKSKLFVSRRVRRQARLIEISSSWYLWNQAHSALSWIAI